MKELRQEITPFGLDIGLVLTDVCEKLDLTTGQTKDVLGEETYQLIFIEPAPTLAQLIDWSRIKASDLICPHCGEPLVHGDTGSLVCQGCTRTLTLVPHDLVVEEETHT